MRLNRFLAQRLGCSRRQADQLILSGKVKVNQELAKLAMEISSTDQIEVYYHSGWLNLRQIAAEKILFYKPVFCLSNPEVWVSQKKTIKHFLPRVLQGFCPVYKLAYMTEGLLLLGRHRQVCKTIKNQLATAQSRFLLATKTKLPSVVDLSWIHNREQPSKFSSIEISYFTDWSEFGYLKLNPHHHWYWVTATALTDSAIISFSLSFGLQRLICVQVGPYRLTTELYKQKWLPAS